MVQRCSTFRISATRRLLLISTLKTAATITMNSPQSLLQLHQLATENKSREEKIYFAEWVREIGLKCIGFNGVCIFRPVP